MQKQRFQLSLEIVHCDEFAALPATAQALYFHAAATSDADGFTSRLLTCKFYSHATDEDVELLVNRGYIEPVEFGGPHELSGYRLVNKEGR